MEIIKNIYRNRGDAMLCLAHKLPFFLMLGHFKTTKLGGCVPALHCITYTWLSAHILVLCLFGFLSKGPFGTP